MAKTGTFLLALVILAALFTSVSHAAFQRSFMNMQIKINEDGSADVRQEIRFYMDNTDSIELYKLSLRTTNDLAGWRNRIGLDDIRFHIDTSVAPIESIRIQPLEPDTCNFERTACYGTFVFDFKVKAPDNGSGLFNISKYIRPRVSSYNLNTSTLSFETALTGDAFIPERTSVEIILPDGASNIRMNPKPAEYTDSIPNGATKLTWQGRLSLANAELYFERKESLISEVTGFFSNLQDRALQWAYSKEGIVLSASLILLIIAYIWLQRSGRPQAGK
jgi:hypothetical protein